MKTFIPPIHLTVTQQSVFFCFSLHPPLTCFLFSSVAWMLSMSFILYSFIPLWRKKSKCHYTSWACPPTQSLHYAPIFHHLPACRCLDLPEQLTQKNDVKLAYSNNSQVFPINILVYNHRIEPAVFFLMYKSDMNRSCMRFCLAPKI